MKKSLIIFVIFITYQSFAQYINIPDSGFEKFLIWKGIDSDNTVNGHILTSDVQNIQELLITNLLNGEYNQENVYIHDITGIESFINLHKLSIYATSVNDIDLTNNSAIDTLQISRNLFLDTFNFQNLQSLKFLVFEENRENSQSNIIFDLSNNPELEYLDCRKNKITQLNVSQNPLLKTLIAGNDLPGCLTTSTDCIPYIDLSHNHQLKFIRIENCQLQNLTLPTVNDLEEIHLQVQNINNFSTVNLSNLKVLDLSYNYLQNVDLQYAVKLERLDLVKSGLQSIDLSYNDKLKLLYLGSYDLGATVYYGYSNNQLQSVDLSHNHLLEVLYTINIGLENIDLSNNLNLRVLNINDNPVNDIDLSYNSLIKRIFINRTNISSIDLSNQAILEHVYIEENPNLSSLNLRNGNNQNISIAILTNNPSLNCIQVDNVSYAENTQGWHKDPGAVYSTDCSTQEIDEYENTGIEIYPNPAIDRLFIDNYTAQETKQIQIFDISGKKVLQTKYTGDYFDIQALQKGIYVLKIQVGEQWISRKLIKE